MSDEVVLLDVDASIATITINRPASMNAFNSAVWHGLERVAHEIAMNDEVHVAILTSAGERAFSPGLDVKSVAAGDFANMGHSGHGPMGRLTWMKGVFTMFEQLPMPVIAAIRGYCLGGGLELALCCDIRLAAENARFGLPEVKIGVVPDLGSTQRLPRVVGWGKAREMIYTSQMIDAAEALRVGLVEHVYPADKLHEEALRLAQTLAAQPAVTLRGAKRAVNVAMSTPLDAGLRIETEISLTSLGPEGLAERAKELENKKR